jgi:hypothetical protein
VSETAAHVDAASAWPDGSALPAQAGYGWERLVDRLAWYERRSGHHKDWFQRLMVLQIVFAAAIPVTAGTRASAWITGSLGASIMMLEGFQHEKHLYLSRAGHYREVAGPDAPLAERVEGLVSQEHSAWSSAQAEAGASRGP